MAKLSACCVINGEARRTIFSRYTHFKLGPFSDVLRSLRWELHHQSVGGQYAVHQRIHDTGIDKPVPHGNVGLARYLAFHEFASGGKCCEKVFIGGCLLVKVPDDADDALWRCAAVRAIRGDLVFLRKVDSKLAVETLPGQNTRLPHTLY